MLGRDVVAVGGEPAEIGRPRLDQLGPPVRQVRRDLDPDVRHQPPALLDQPLDVLDRDRRRPARRLEQSPSAAREWRTGTPPGPPSCAPGRGPRPPPTFRAKPRSAMSATSRAVVARVRDEVLEDHLLEVAVALVRPRQRFQRCDPLLLGLADADQDPARERDPQLAGGFDRRQPPGRVLGRRAAWTVSISRSETDSSISPCEAVTSRSRARSSRVEDAEVRVGQDAALQRPLAGPDDVGGEVLVAPLGEPGGDLGVDLGALAGEDEQLLGVAALRLVELRLDLLGRVDVRPMGREGAVLAVALAGAREGERVVAREGDPPHAAHATASGGRARATAERRGRRTRCVTAVRRRLRSGSRLCFRLRRLRLAAAAPACAEAL